MFQLVVHHAGLERMNSENQRLRDMGDEVTTNYNNLQMHLVTFIQQQQQKVDNNEVEADVVGENNNKGEQFVRQNSRRNTVPRRFIDLSHSFGERKAIYSFNKNYRIKGFKKL